MTEVETAELAFANNRKDAERLADELGGRVVRVPDRRGWVVIPEANPAAPTRPSPTTRGH